MVGQPDRGQRVFAWALTASLVLHAVVLAVRMPEFSGPAEFAAPALVVHVVRVEPYVEPPAAPKAPEVAPPKPEKPRPVRKPAPPVATPAPSPKAEAPAPAPAPAAPPAAPTPPAAEQSPAASQPAPEAPRVASAPAAQVVAPDTTTIARYRQRLISEAVRYKRYPPRAVDNGWEGDVVLRINVGPNGEISEFTVRRGSGHSVLDEQALEMFRRAAPRVPVPPSLRGQAFAFDVRAIYSLKDQ
jgi:periplasmic protein TonB